MPNKVLVALPSGLLEQVDFIAGCEHRTRSDLIREALRRYIDGFKRNQQPAARQNQGQAPVVNPINPGPTSVVVFPDFK